VLSYADSPSLSNSNIERCTCSCPSPPLRRAEAPTAPTVGFANQPCNRFRAFGGMLASASVMQTKPSKPLDSSDSRAIWTAFDFPRRCSISMSSWFANAFGCFSSHRLIRRTVSSVEAESIASRVKLTPSCEARFASFVSMTSASFHTGRRTVMGRGSVFLSG